MNPEPSQPTRTIHHTDALQWLADQPVLEGCSVISSLPDISEFPNFTLEQWKNWFIKAAALVMSRCSDLGMSIFYQTDIKREGVWVDKGFLCQKAAEEVGHELLFHKIICRTPPGTTTHGRPAYAHMLCFSKSLRHEIKVSLPDVLPGTGKVTWTRGMGVEACKLACRLVIDNTKTHTIVDPFCGHGTVLAVANSMGLHAIGVELGGKRARTAEKLKLSDIK